MCRYTKSLILSPLLVTVLCTTISKIAIEWDSCAEYIRFRWVSLQLQSLCRLRIEAVVRKRSGELPLDLRDIYNEAYDEDTLQKRQRSPGLHLDCCYLYRSNLTQRIFSALSRSAKTRKDRYLEMTSSTFMLVLWSWILSETSFAFPIYLVENS